MYIKQSEIKVSIDSQKAQFNIIKARRKIFILIPAAITKMFWSKIKCKLTSKSSNH